MTFRVRLNATGMTGKNGLIEEVMMNAIPSVGDAVSLDYGQNDKRAYTVLSRRFHVACTQSDTENKFDFIALEVEEI